MNRRPRVRPSEAEKARTLLVLQANFVTMHGLAATQAELDVLRHRAQAAEAFVKDDAALELLRVAALDCVVANPLTEENLGALKSAHDAIAARVKGDTGVTHHAWMDRSDLA